MFELEIMHLVNEFNNSNEIRQNEIKQSISKLIKENNQEFNQFISQSNLEPNVKKLLNQCSLNFTSKISKDESDFDLIKLRYEKWLNYFVSNNRIPEQNCENIILEIINFYALNRFEVLEQIFKINDNDDFEAFKSMLKNYLRKYFAQKILKYYQSEAFLDLGFFEKRKKKNLILKLLEEIGSYKFDIKKIRSLI